MSKTSYTLFRNDDGTWRAEIPWEGRISVHQTKTKDRAEAERRAKHRVHRLPIEYKAHRAFNERVKRERAELRAAKQAAKKTAAPPIDAGATAAKLKALPIDSGAGEVEPPAPPLPAAPDPTPAPEIETPEGAPAKPLPELPPTPPPGEPIKPEIGDDRKEEDDTEGREFFADVAAVAVVAGTIKGVTSWQTKRGKKVNDPSPKALDWYREGLQYRFRQFMGDAGLGPGMKLLVGGAGVILSMVWGAEDLDPSKPRPKPEQAAAPAPAPAPTNNDDAGGEPHTDGDDFAEPVPQQQLERHNGTAAGKFR